MSRKKRSTNRTNVGLTNVDNMQTPNPVDQESPAPVTTTEVVEDSLTAKNQDTPAPAEEQAPQSDGDESQDTSESSDEQQVEADADEEEIVEETVEETPAEEVVVDVSPQGEEDKLVAGLNEKLAELKSYLEGFGSDPKDFKLAAKKASEVTKYVLKYPKVKVLDALLAFFVENKDGVAAGAEILKGSTTLPGSEERATGTLFGLFTDLANRRVVGVNTGFVTAILKKPEVVNYYNRRKEGIKASKKQ